MTNIQQRLLNEWDRDDDYPRAKEDELRQFEAEFGAIPPDFRWFLAHCGGGGVGREWVDGIRQLPASHKKFQKEFGPGGWTMTGVFIIGWDGWGNPFGVETSSGRILVEDHNTGKISELAPSLWKFLEQELV